MNENEALLAILDENLVDLKRFLQQKQKIRLLPKNYFHDLTLNLILGPERSGKTEFLQHADLSLIQKKTHLVSCNMGVHSNAIFIEAPSLRTESGENTRLTAFIEHLNEQIPKKPFDNLIFVLNLSLLARYTHKDLKAYWENILTDLKTSLASLVQSDTSCYIVFTHMDQIAGFSEFFSELNTKEQQQAWGYSLSYYASKDAALAQNEEQHRHFLQILHDNLITRLHKTRSHATRSLIREFPLQIESLRHIIDLGISKITDLFGTTLQLKGIFFESARQTAQALDRIAPSIAKPYALTLNVTLIPPAIELPYFIKGIIETIVRVKQPHISKYPKIRWYHAVSFACVMGMLGVLGYNFYTSEQKIGQASLELQKYEQAIRRSPNLTLSQIIPALWHLSKAQHALATAFSPWQIPFQNTQKLQAYVNTQYHEALKNKFLPALAHTIEQNLRHATDPNKQHSALKAYLMLGNPNHLDLSYLKTWFQNTGTPLDFAFQSLLKSAFTKPLHAIALDRLLIQNIRNNLNTLPPDYLAYFFVKNKLLALSLPFKNQAFTLKNNSIPFFYTKQGYTQVAKTWLPQTIQQLKQETWVLKSNALAQKSQQQLKEAALLLYVSDYANWWKILIFRTQPKLFYTFNEAHQYFASLSKKPYFYDWINLIQKNTKPFLHKKGHQIIFNTRVANQFTDLHLITPHNIQSLSSLFDDLAQYFSTLETSEDLDKIAFEIAKTRFENPKHPDPIYALFDAQKKLSSPIDAWTYAIAKNSWFLILHHAHAYINRQWKATVFSEYEHNILPYFPFNPKGTPLTLEKFTYFFGKTGSLEQFYLYYLKPFLNTKSASWHARSLEALHMEITPKAVLELERANVIRQMFFTKDALLPTFDFSLQTLETTSLVKNITLDINGQSLPEGTRQQATHFSWPADYKNYPVALSIENKTGTQYHLTEYGPWGLFRLLNQSEKRSLNPTHFQLIFNLNGSAVKYLLSTEQAINPFIFSVLTEFSLPPEIV